MSELYTKMKNIRKKVGTADAVSRHLEAAKNNYNEGCYNGCSDDLAKVKMLDPAHPEAQTLEKHVERRREGEVVIDDNYFEDVYSKIQNQIESLTNELKEKSCADVEYVKQINARLSNLESRIERCAEKNAIPDNLETIMFRLESLERKIQDTVEKRILSMRFNQISSRLDLLEKTQTHMSTISPLRGVTNLVLRLKTNRKYPRKWLRTTLAGVSVLLILMLLYFVFHSYVIAALGWTGGMIVGIAKSAWGFIKMLLVAGVFFLFILYIFGWLTG